MAKVTTESELTRQFATWQLFHRPAWEDDWTEIKNASDMSVSFTLSPSIGRATFTIHNGRLLLTGKQNPENIDIDVESILGQYVKVEITLELTKGRDQPTKKTWYGIATDARQIVLGDTQEKPEDWQVTCHDFKWLLGRKQITKSKVVNNGETIEIDRGLAFNSPWGEEINEQNSVGNYDAGAEAFAEFFVSSSPWNSSVILDYLFDNYAPHSEAITWELDQELDDPLLWYEPIVSQHNRTLLEIINDCIPRRRGLGWYLDINEKDSKVSLKTVSFLESEVSLPGGGILPGNPDVIDIDLSSQPHSELVSRTVSKQETYQQVRVVGDRKGVVATLAVGGQLVKGWTTSEEQTYKDAASGSAGYVNLTIAEKSQRNDSRRMSDETSKVYSHLVLKDDWDGGSIVTEDIWVNGIRFEPFLPMFAGYDYTNPSSPSLAGQREGERLRPIVVCSLAPISKFEQVEKLSSSAMLEHYGRGIDWACNVVMMSNRPGIEINPTAAPHVFGKGHFENDEEPSDYFPRIDYETIEATVYFRLDSFCEGVYPSDPEDEEHDIQTILTIDIGSRAKLDEIKIGTILGLEDGEKITASSSGFIRDDRGLCEDLARTAWMVYGTPRQSIEVRLNKITDQVWPGQLIRKFIRINDETIVNSLVTSISWDLARGVTSLSSEYLELDFAGLV